MELQSQLPEDYEERMLAASIDCAAGDATKATATACHMVGEFFTTIRRDYEAAREAYGKNCDERRHGPSCFNLGRLLIAGKGGDADEAAASRRFSEACDAGHGPGCHFLGLLALETGDDAGGCKILDAACRVHRDAPSCFFVGSRLLKTPQRTEAGAAAAASAAPEGPKAPGAAATSEQNAGAQSQWWSSRWRARPSAARDPVKAKTYLEIACEQGHAPACHNLAVMFKLGDTNVPADPTQHEKYATRTRELVKAAGAMQGLEVV